VLLWGLAAIPALSFSPDTETRLTSDSPSWFAALGTSVAVDGQTAVVGAPYSYAGGAPGAAYVFVRDPDGWSLEAILAGDAAFAGVFGEAVAISGDTLVIGDPEDSSEGGNAGAAYVYQRVDGVWLLQAKLLVGDPLGGQALGSAVAICGDRIALGAPFDKQPVSGSGAVYVFVRNHSTWELEAKLKAAALTADQFGTAVSIHGTTLAVGAPYRAVDTATQAGAVYVFDRQADGWASPVELTASDPSLNSYLGWSVAIEDGLVVAGAPGESTVASYAGAAYVFELTPAGWNEAAKLTADDAAHSDQFGYATALSDRFVAIGAFQDSSYTHSGGTVYRFRKEITHWVQQFELSPNEGGQGDEFGSGVALSGPYLAVGAPLADAPMMDCGAAYVYESAAQASLPANTAPVADASVTAKEIIVPNKTGAQFVLDGSASLDPEGDPLTYTWAEGAEVLGHGVQCQVNLSLGTHSITLTVDDGQMSDSTTVEVEVVGAGQAIRDLKPLLRKSGIRWPHRRICCWLLEVSARCFDRGRPEVGLRLLRIVERIATLPGKRRGDPERVKVFTDALQNIAEAVTTR
jgi:hypothetical protein